MPLALGVAEETEQMPFTFEELLEGSTDTHITGIRFQGHRSILDGMGKEAGPGKSFLGLLKKRTDSVRPRNGE